MTVADVIPLLKQSDRGTTVVDVIPWILQSDRRMLPAPTRDAEMWNRIQILQRRIMSNLNTPPVSRFQETLVEVGQCPSKNLSCRTVWSSQIKRNGRAFASYYILRLRRVTVEGLHSRRVCRRRIGVKVGMRSRYVEHPGG